MSKNQNPVPKEEQAKSNLPEEETVFGQQPTCEKPEEVKAPDPALAAAEAALAESKDQYIRLLAEYDNYRKRTLKEKESIYMDAKASAVATLLPVYDNLCRALAAETADEAYRKGVEMTLNQCVSAFESLGVAKIPALGTNFDPNFHNAVMHVEDETVGENIVVEVFQEGFLLGERIIRASMVKVAN